MSLAPPTEPIEDPGAKDLVAAEESDDHFSDASEGRFPPPLQGRNRALSIPVTRVEKVDDEPRHGEVPGTDAYKIRSQDAVPDEIEIVPDGTRSRSASRVSESDRPLTPGGTPIPKIIAEKLEPEKPSYGDVPGTPAHEMRLADAQPDEVIKAPSTHAERKSRMSASFPRSTKPSCLTKKASPTPNDRSRSPSPVSDEPQPSLLAQSVTENKQDSQTTPSTQSPIINTALPPTGESAEDFDKDDDFGDEQQRPAEQQEHQHQEPSNDENEQQVEEDDDDGFGEDFDDFEEGGADQGNGEDDDFGDFDDGFQEPEPTPAAAPPVPTQPVPQPLAHLPNLNLSHLKTSDDILSALTPYMAELFPELTSSDNMSTTTKPTIPNEPILTDRSASLWSQLVAPPPLQPPNWIRSRIRRLFLVSLGVPVDLDEILPASKQKKLVLPNIHLSTPQPSDKETQKSKPTSTSSRKGPLPPPDFNSNEALLLAKTTDEAASQFEDEELKAHVRRLEELIEQASETLEYWVKRKESAVGDKEAFEGVIENLVGFVKSRR